MIAVLASVPAAPPSVSPSDVAVQAIKSVIVVIFLLGGFRLFGKRELAQLSVYDLAMLFALSNAVQNAMTAGKGNLAVGLATSSAVVVTGWLLIRLVVGRPKLAKRIIGSPTILINDGQVLAGRIRQERITQDELSAAIRAYGLEGTQDVALAVLEVDGSISVVPRAGGAQ